LEQNHISKGIYQHSQIGNFISVKNYIFIRQNGKKHLMLRFSNDFGYVADSMTYFVVQMDNAGKVLARTKVTNAALAFRPGTMYVTEQPICVDEYCSDFKIVFAEVVSGSYRYEVHSDTIAVHYIKEMSPVMALSALSKSEKRRRRDDSVKRYGAEQKKFHEKGVAAFISSITAVLLLFLSVAAMCCHYVLYLNPKFIRSVPYVGDFLGKAYEALSSVSERMNAFSSAGALLLMIAVSFGLFFAYLTVSYLKSRRSAKQKRNFYERRADGAQK